MQRWKDTVALWRDGFCWNGSGGVDDSDPVIPSLRSGDILAVQKLWSLRKRHELRPTGHAVQPASLVEAPDLRFEFMPRHRFEQLGEEYAMVRQVLHFERGVGPAGLFQGS